MEKLSNQMLRYSGGFAVLLNVKPEEMRPIDLKEFQDAVPSYESSDFNAWLALALGLVDINCKVAYTRRGEEPVFIATAFRINRASTDKRLCGFAWRKADAETSRRERLQIIRFGVEKLILDDPGVNFDCIVHKENHDTLTSWKLIGKLYSEQLEVKFIPMCRPDYIRVAITKRSN